MSSGGPFWRALRDDQQAILGLPSHLSRESLIPDICDDDPNLPACLIQTWCAKKEAQFVVDEDDSPQERIRKEEARQRFRGTLVTAEKWLVFFDNVVEPYGNQVTRFCVDVNGNPVPYRKNRKRNPDAIKFEDDPEFVVRFLNIL